MNSGQHSEKMEINYSMYIREIPEGIMLGSNSRARVGFRLSAARVNYCHYLMHCFHGSFRQTPHTLIKNISWEIGIKMII